MTTDTLIKRYRLVSDQIDVRELRVCLLELEKLLRMGVAGNVVEFGCYTGTTALFIRRILDAYKSTAEYHVYDSFEGLPEKTALDRSPVGLQFVPGELLASKRQLITNFQKAQLRLPVIHKGWFWALGPESVPDQIMFAFLDGDYYESIRDSLALIAPNLAKHAVIVVDDYANEALPGAAAATDEWLRGTGWKKRIEASLAILTP